LNALTFTAACANLEFANAELLVKDLVKKLENYSAYSLLFALQSYLLLEQTGKAVPLYQAIDAAMKNRQKSSRSLNKIFNSMSEEDPDSLDELWSAIQARGEDF